MFTEKLSTWTLHWPPTPLKWTNVDIWLTTYPPPFVHVVFEWPQDWLLGIYVLMFCISRGGESRQILGATVGKASLVITIFTLIQNFQFSKFFFPRKAHKNSQILDAHPPLLTPFFSVILEAKKILRLTIDDSLFLKFKKHLAPGLDFVQFIWHSLLEKLWIANVKLWKIGWRDEVCMHLLAKHNTCRGVGKRGVGGATTPLLPLPH